MKFKHFHSQKCIWKCYRGRSHFVSASMCYPVRPARHDFFNRNITMFSELSATSTSRLYRSFNLSQAWWCHQMETFSVLLAICAGNSPVTGEFPSQRPVMRSFGVFFDLRLNNRLSKQSCRRWFETPSRSLWRHRNGKTAIYMPNQYLTMLTSMS